MKVLILANTRFKGGLSGSDAIYESFKKYWPCEVIVSDLVSLDYRPMFACYLQRIIVGCWRALLDSNKYEFVYSSSDFLPDTIPACIYRLKGQRWVAGFYLNAFKDNPIHYWTQQVVKGIIRWLADMVIVTNPTMFDVFPDKPKTWINGGIELSLAGLSDEPKIYDAVFCGRIHPSKGIDELLEIWDLVRDKLPKARLALIGDGDLGVDYIKHKLFAKHGLNQYNGIDLLGYMGDERYNIYKQSKVVLYPTPLKYDHFSMAPVEAMACGCPMICFWNPVNREMREIKDMSDITTATDIENFIECFLFIMKGFKFPRKNAFNWAQQFDYQKQSLRVWKEINENFGYRKQWNPWDSD